MKQSNVGDAPDTPVVISTRSAINTTASVNTRAYVPLFMRTLNMSTLGDFKYRITHEETEYTQDPRPWYQKWFGAPFDKKVISKVFAIRWSLRTNQGTVPADYAEATRAIRGTYEEARGTAERVSRECLLLMQAAGYQVFVNPPTLIAPSSLETLPQDTVP